MQASGPFTLLTILHLRLNDGLLKLHLSYDIVFLGKYACNLRRANKTALLACGGSLSKRLALAPGASRSCEEVIGGTGSKRDSPLRLGMFEAM